MMNSDINRMHNRSNKRSYANKSRSSLLNCITRQNFRKTNGNNKSHIHCSIYNETKF